VRLLRIVPDDTKFDFMRFRRISFPISALLSIAAIALFFFHGLNFGIDFVGGTLMEVQTKAGPADLAKMRATIGGLKLGDFQLQEFGAPNDVLIRISEQPGGDEAQQAAVQKVREALGDEVDYRRVEVVGPSVSTELLSYGTIGLVLAIGAILISASLMSDPAWRPAAPVLLAISVAGAIAYLLLGGAAKHHHAPGGLYERIFLGLELLWIVIAAIAVARRTPATQPE